MIPKENRLRLKKAFERIFNDGKWGGQGCISLKYKPMEGSDPKIGFMVGKKVSKSAVKRNRIKRQLREMVRLMLKSGKFTGKYDVIVIAKPEAERKDPKEKEKDLRDALEKASIIQP